MSTKAVENASAPSFVFLNRLRVDAVLHDVAEAVEQNGADRAELALDDVDLLDELLQDDVLGAVGVDEVVAPHLRCRLHGAIVATVALLDARRVPRHVEVEEIGAVALEVHALAGGIGRDQDADRVILGR